MTEDEAARVLRVCTRTPRKARLCGQWPRFLCYQSAEDSVTSWFACSATPIPGGGATGCGRAGPECEDAYSDRATAAWLWDRAIRQARKPTP